MQLLYLGFTQEANMRCYRFEGVMPKDRLIPKVLNLGFSLKTDMALLALHHIRIQDVPDLCLDLLAQRLGANPDSRKIPCASARSGELFASEAREGCRNTQRARIPHVLSGWGQ